MNVKLYIGNKNYSSWSLRPWLCLKKAGIAFEEEIIPLDVPGFKEKYCLSQVPALCLFW